MIPVGRYLVADARFSDCGRYRYSLTRVWTWSDPKSLFVMLNPSTASKTSDDPTIRSCARLAKSLGYGRLEVVNLFGLISADPSALVSDPAPIGDGNERAVHDAIIRNDVVILAWGASAVAAERSQFFLEWLKGVRSPVYCLGKTKTGAPKHPLYIKSGTALEVYP